MAPRSPELDASRSISLETGGNSRTLAADTSGATEILLPTAQFATDASYVQQGDDLLLVGRDGMVFVVRGYFLLDNPPDLTTPEGGRITAALVESFTPPESAGQFAQAGQVAQAAQPIGQVKDLAGQVFAVRADGTRVKLDAGDPVYQGDIIETADSGAVNMVFVDETTFALGGDARLALDKMVFDPATQLGQSSFSILKGVFVFVSGQIAHHDYTKMQVNTPVATIGIRGTRVAGEIKPAGEESKFTVIEGEIAVSTQGGTVIMGGQNETTTVTSSSAPPTAPVILSQSEVNQSYSDVRAISGGLLNSGGQSQEGPAESGPQAPGVGDADSGGEGGGEGIGEGAAGATGEEAAGEGVGGGEGEGEGGEGEGEAVAETEGEGGAEGGAEAEGEALEGEAEGRALAAGGEQTQEGADGEGGEAQPGDGEGGDGEGGENLSGDGEGGENLTGEGDGEGGEAPLGDGPDGEQQSGDGEFQSVDSGDNLAGDGLDGGGDSYGGDGLFYDGGAPDVGDGGFGDTGDPLAGGDFDGFLDGGDFTGDEPPPPPPPDDQNDSVDSGTITADPPFFIDLSAEVTAQIIGGGTNNDTLIGGSGADDIDGFGGNDTLTGNAGDDTITGGAGDDVVFGGVGNGLIIAGSGQGFDTYAGETGADTLSFSSTFLGIVADMATGTASGAEIDTDSFTGFEVLIGGSGADTLDGDAGINAIFGGAGDDIIDGFGGIDTIQGGAGDDTIGFDTSPETIDGGAGIDKIRLFGAPQLVNAANLVNVGSIEEIDLGGVGSNTLAVNSALVTAVSGTGTLTALGDGDDLVDSSSNWNLTGPFTLGSTVFDRFTDGGSTVDSETSIFRSTGTINFDAGASLTHNIVNLGSLTTSDGTYTNNGSITLGGSGDIDMSGSKTLAGTGTFTNEQSLSLTDDTISAVLDGGIGTLGLDGTVTVNGKLIIGASTFVDGTISTVLQGSGTVVTQGTHEIDDGGTFSVATLRNKGVLDFTTLTSTITSGTIENVAGASVNFGVDTTIDMAPGNTLTNAGLAQLQGSANLNFLDGLIANAGTLDVVAGASTFVVTNGVVSMLAGGDVIGAGTLDLTASNFNIGTGVGFTLGSAGTGPHLEMTSSNIAGAGTLVNESDIVIDNASTISVSTFTNSNGGTLDHADGTLSVTSVFENQANANLVVDTTLSNTDISFSNGFTNSGLVKFVGANQGAITIGGGAGTLTNTATGTIQVLDGDNSLNGVLVNPTGGIVEVNATGSGLAHLDFSSSFTNDGLLHLTASGLATQIARFSQSGAGSTLTNTGTIAMDGGIASAVLETCGNLDNQGLISANSVSDTGLSPIVGVNASITNSGTISITGGTKFDVGFATGTTGVTSFANSGTLDVSGNLVLQQTTLSNTGSLQTVSGARIDVVENSVLDLTADVVAVAGSTIAVGNGAVSGSGTLFNAGFLTLNNGTLSGNVNDSSGAVSIQGGSNLNSGVLEFGQNTSLNFGASTDKFANTGTIDVNGSSTLTVDTGTLHNQSAGTINASGGTIVTSTGGIFQNDGALNFGASPGTLTIGGDFASGDEATMLIELGGLAAGIHDGFDQLTVTGEFDAGGTMNVVEFGGFDVSVGDSFAIVDAGTLTGSFREISGLEVGGGVVLDAAQSATGVILTGRAVTHQGTANEDTLTGGAGAGGDVIVGEGGNDVIVGGGGADLMHGGAGDDVFVAADTGFGRLDGGSGSDTVRFGSGSFDLTGLRGDQLSGVEHFDLSGSGDNTLTLDAEIVLAATGGVNPLTGAVDSLLIDGDSGDAVTAQGDWTVSVRSGRGMGPVKRISHVEARPHKVLSFCW